MKFEFRFLVETDKEMDDSVIKEHVEAVRKIVSILENHVGEVQTIKVIQIIEKEEANKSESSL